MALKDWLLSLQRFVFPWDPSRGWITTPKGIQKWVPVTLDVAFQDKIGGQTSRGNMAQFARGLICTAAGNVNVTFLDGTTATIPIATGNTYLQCEIIQVNTTGTTATGLFWGY